MNTGKKYVMLFLT